MSQAWDEQGFGMDSAEAALALDPEACRLVQDSLGLLVGGLLPQHFIAHLAAIVQDRHLAPAGDLPIVLDRWCQTLFLAMNPSTESARSAAELQALGADFYCRGVDSEIYHYAGHALVRAVRDAYPEEWSTMLGSAWIAFYEWMTVQMAAGAAEFHAAHGEPLAYRSTRAARRSGPARMVERTL